MALNQGMKTLRQNALQKVLEGVTTVEEVLRVTVS
jgi:type II secretory ATPase GspE/PulE/Tfp pilus assembly ATPase PilB-like protein